MKLLRNTSFSLYSVKSKGSICSLTSVHILPFGVAEQYRPTDVMLIWHLGRKR